MTKHLPALIAIFLCAAFGWGILGYVVQTRTAESDIPQRQRLTGEWGGKQVQAAPVIVSEKGAPATILSSKIALQLDLEPRQKGLLWYNPYAASFSATYRVANTTGSQHLFLRLPLPQASSSYSDVRYTVGGVRYEDTAEGTIPFELAPGEQTTVSLSYRSRGMDSWSYAFADKQQTVKNLDFTITTNFANVDFPANGLSPVAKQQTGNGWTLHWTDQSLITKDVIGVVVPDPLQPGPLAERITFWAPLALLFYMFVMVVTTYTRGVPLLPTHYFFLACAFFAFHLLFGYLVDRVDLGIAFVICSAVSVFLTVSYLRVVAGWRTAAIESGLAQLVYLVLFSWALFNEGWSGLTITIGAIVTLFVMMQISARAERNSRLAA